MITFLQQYSELFWAALAIGALVLIIKALFPTILSKKGKKLFIGKELLTPNEFEFFRRIEKALPSVYIFPQVALSAIIDVNPQILGFKGKGQENRSLRNHFAQKRLDYLLCDKKLKPICIIELDDRSHVAEKDKARDAMTQQAGFATIRYWSDKARRPDSQEIKKDVLNVAKSLGQNFDI